MFWYWVFWLFIFGLVIGSFLNVVVYRTIYGESPLKGRSVCPHCKKQISWKHNIPLLSFLFLRGKCAHCKKRISWQYPVVEGLTALLFVWWYVMGKGFFLLVNTPLELVQPYFWLMVGVLLLLVLVFDLWYGVIPNAVNLLLLVLVLGYRVALVVMGIMRPQDFWMAVVAGIGLALFFYGLYLLTKRKGFGLGDVKLAPSLGLLLGLRGTIVATMLSFMSGAIVAVVLLVLGRKRFGQTIPFGPFLVLGAVMALLWHELIWEWYFGLLR